jgi:alpha-1,3-rhamnosyl/mannosyltransferase
VPGNPGGRYILFLGTLEPRKNIGGLLEAYGALLEEDRAVPPLLLAGRTTPAAAGWLETMARPPLSGRVEHRGYVAPDARQGLLAGARLLVLPSFDEGFGLPVLEAMSLGIPVVASRRGAVPEVAGDAALLVDPEDARGIALAMARVLDEPGLARELGEKGVERAAAFSWTRTAALTREAYERALATSLGREGR